VSSTKTCVAHPPRLAQVAMALALCVASISIVIGASVSDAQASSIAGHSAWPTWGHFTSLGVNPDLNHRLPGQIPHISGQAGDEVSSNWAGLVESGAEYTAVASYWTVPTVQPSQTSQVSSTWIGIDGATPDDTSLIQTGTQQDTSGGSTSYFAWYEILPSPEVEIGTVSPGDEMEASIEEDSPGTWTISIEDLTSDQGTSGDVSYDGPGESAEWIEEQTTVEPGPEPPLADFGTVQFSDLGIGTPDPSDVVETPTFMANSDGDITAYPGGFVNDDMTVTYGQPPTATAISASPNPTTYGGSVTYSASVTSAEGVPDGDVTFSADSTALCTATLSNGTGSCTSSAAPVGSDTVSGTYPGDNVFAGSTGNTSILVDPPAASPPTPSTSPHGYWLVGSDGGIFNFGSAGFYGSTGSLQLQRPVVGIVPTADRDGYWLDASDGGVFAFGDAGFFGSITGLGLHPAGSGLPNSLNAPIVGMVPSADGGGYFMVASDGGVFAFGDAHFAGSCPGIGGCSGPAVAVMPDATGNGYWLVTRTGNVYAFGDAPNYGSPGAQSVPVTSAVRTPNGGGYWILFANGVIAPYGDAGDYGDAAGAFGGLNPAMAIFTTSDGGGYWIASANGTVDQYGDAPNDGGMAGTHLNGSIIAATGF
jgi:hypothetical protein